MSSTEPLFEGFEAVHILPLEKGSLWVENNYGRWITNMDNVNGVSKINSLQNGFLLHLNVHQLFDQYLISVNLDVSISSTEYILIYTD